MAEAKTFTTLRQLINDGKWSLEMDHALHYILADVAKKGREAWKKAEAAGLSKSRLELEESAPASGMQS